VKSLPVCLSAFGLLASFAGSPTLEHFHPVALARGTTNRVAAVGKFEPWPPEFWVAGQGVTLTATTNQTTVEIVVAADAELGPRLVRAFSDEGASASRFLVITDSPPLAETEPNDGRAQAQVVTNTPAWLNGRLDRNGDVDQFAVDLAAGQTLAASLQAYVLQSPVDPALRLTDPRGVEVQFNHDDGLTLDPRLVFTAERPGRHTLQVFGFAHPAGSDVRFTGNEKCVYRLYLHAGPAVAHTVPLGVQHGATNQLELIGWNISGERVAPTAFLDASIVETNAEWWTPSIPGFEYLPRLPVGKGPEVVEREPNSDAGSAQELPVPGAVTGRIDPAGDVDRYAFPARKDERLVVSVQAAALGFPLDAWLAIENAEGKELTRIDDADSADPRIEWTAPADGRFVLVVGNLLRRGGADHLYRLSVEPGVPDFRPTVDAAEFTLTAGTTNEVKVALVRRHGHKGKLTMRTEGLPPAVESGPVEVAETATEAVLRWSAPTNAPRFNGPVRVLVAGDGRERAAVFALASTGENNGVPQGYTDLLIRGTESFWLTVLPPKPAESKPDEKK
jgi:hypothetical protein